MPKKPKKMYMVFSPRGERQYQSLRFSSTKCKSDWAGGSIRDWQGWKDNGWFVMAVTVDVRVIYKGYQGKNNERSVATDAS